MPARFMLDTNVLIEIRKRNASVISRFVAIDMGEAVMSVITYGELLFGAYKSRSQKDAIAKIALIAADVRVQGFSAAAASDYADIRSHLQRRGELIGPNDLWIAAHARALGLTLVTGNEREFRRVPGLAVENWAAA